MAAKKAKKRRKNKPGGGRPRVHAENPARVLLLLSPATLDAIDAARHADETRMDLIRRAIACELKRRER